MIKNILLDLDDTILDFHRAERIALGRALTSWGIPVTEETLTLYHGINRDCWQKLERGEYTREQVLVGRFERLFEALGLHAVTAREARATYESFLAEGHYFIDGAEKLLEYLAPRYALYLASNGDARVQAGRIGSAGIAKYFKDMIISEHTGYAKPALGYFRAVFARIPNFKHEETVIVGDSLTSDIKGGIDAGIRQVWFNPAGAENHTDIKPTFEIRTLEELPKLLETL